MANLYPSIFPLDPDNPEMFKKGKITEKKVFNKIGKIYDENVDVFYGIEFITENLRGIKDFEFTDFIIIHPKMGILFLECKGGLLEYQKIERFHKQIRYGAFMTHNSTHFKKLKDFLMNLKKDEWSYKWLDHWDNEDTSPFYSGRHRLNS